MGEAARGRSAPFDPRRSRRGRGSLHTELVGSTALGRLRKLLAVFVPHDEEELAAALLAGSLQETATFEGKAFPTSAHGNIEIAKDVAAMATDGGVILYGIGEDGHKRLTVDSAFPLAGQPERISNIVRTDLSDPPTIKIRAIEKSTKAGHGYLVVEVPQSPRAPHMVQIKGENRFYGRDSTGNRILTAGDVERLYRLRVEWERGADELVQRAIEKRPGLPFMPEGHGLFYLVARPLTTDDRLLDRVLIDDPVGPALNQRFRGDVQGCVGTTWRHSNEGVLATQINSSSPAELEVSRNGVARFFWVVTARGKGNEFLVRDRQLARTVTSLLLRLGELYASGGLTCAVDLGMALQGAQGAISAFALGQLEIIVEQPLHQNDYRRTARTTVDALVEAPAEAARDLIGPVLDELSQRAFDPFAI